MKKKIGFVFLVIFIILFVVLTMSRPFSESRQEQLPEESTPSDAVQESEQPEPEIMFDGVVVDENTKMIQLVESSSLEELVSLVEELADLETIDFGSREPSADELAMLIDAYPNAELKYTVSIAGRTVSSGTKELDLSGLKCADVDAVAGEIKKLHTLEYVNLMDASGTVGGLQFEDVGKLQQARPDVGFNYVFELFGKTFSTADEIMDLNHIRMNDGGDAVKSVLPYMTKCTYLDMDSCGLSNEQMQDIRDSFPSMKVVWRINFGSQYSVRTDVEKILASVKGEWLTGEGVAALKYCTDVKYLDLGHNIINDISFVSYMPKLEVAVLAINYWSDATPLSNCKNLEYLEVFNTFLSDLTPLAELTNLKHLNISWLENVNDITPLYGLTNLERLWIGSMTPIPQDQIDTIREKLPNCVINTTTDNPTEEGWREGERYELLKDQFGYDEGAYSFYWLDEKYYPSN